MLQAHIIHRSSKPESWEQLEPSHLIKHHFRDTDDSNYSVQHFLATALGRDIRVGQWLSPHVAALVIQDMFKNKVSTVVSVDRMLFKSEMKNKDNCLIIIPMRLGPGEKASSIYKRDVIRYTQFPQFAGILGGKPRHALFLVGYELSGGTKKMLCVDPHSIMLPDSVSPSAVLNSVAFEELDPCMAVSFYCANAQEKEDLFFRLQKDPLIDVQDNRESIENMQDVVLTDFE